MMPRLSRRAFLAATAATALPLPALALPDHRLRAAPARLRLVPEVLGRDRSRNRHPPRGDLHRRGYGGMIPQEMGVEIAHHGNGFWFLNGQAGEGHDHGPRLMLEEGRSHVIAMTNPPPFITRSTCTAMPSACSAVTPGPRRTATGATRC